MKQRGGAFSETSYQASLSKFYALPSKWGEPDGVLAQLWQRGGVGAISLVPVLGEYARASFRRGVRLPFDSAARLGGIDAGTARKSARAFKELGLADYSVCRFRGQQLAEWQLSDSFSIGVGDNQRLLPDYFYFPMRLVHGGNWARLSGAQRALYLSVGAGSIALEAARAKMFLAQTLAEGVSTRDVDASAAAGQDGKVRVASMSYAALADRSSLRRESLRRAAGALKHPNIWRGSQNDPANLRHSPLAPYPAAPGYEMLFHLRDHAPRVDIEALKPVRDRSRTSGVLRTQDERFDYGVFR